MSITSYPRVTVQGTNALNNTQNGNALMILNPSTGLYEAATASTFGGGGSGGSATSANQTTQIGLETTLNGIVSTAALQTTLNNSVATAANQTTLNGIVSTAALQTTLNNSVSTAANQTTEIAFLQSLDSNVKSIRIDKIVQPQQVGYNYVGMSDLTKMSTVLSGITIAANQIGILQSGPNGGFYTGDSTYFYGAIANSSGYIIFGVTRIGCFIDNWTYNNTYLYSNLTTWNLRVFNKSDLIL